MALDATDKRLVRGLLWIAVVAVIAYFLPGYGYQALCKNEETAREEAERLKSNFDKYYHPPMTDAHLGRTAADTLAEQPGNTALIEARHAEFSDSNAAIEAKLEDEKQRCKMPFGSGDATWVDVPENTREPGVYFSKMYEEKRSALEKYCKSNGVELSDREIGFKKKFEGLVKSLNQKEKAEEFLRELYIAESVVRLCVKAKKAQEEEEIRQAVKPEAYMHIISVTPQDSKATGPFILKRNAKYDEKTANRLSAKGRRYILEPLPKFIQEYPVEIVLHCDANTFRRFLRSVREPGKFLVIRSLEMISPFLAGSETDKSELAVIQNEIKQNDASGEKGKKIDLKDEHIGVRLSAAGMDFFDPNVLPNGFYQPAKETGKPAGSKKSRRAAGSGN
jgi:hypothetical protein